MVQRLPSSAERRFQTLKHDLTLQVYLRDGTFWESVHDLRERWKIEPPVRVPGHDDSLWPKVLESLGSSPKEQRLLSVLARRWKAAIDDLHDMHVASTLLRGDKHVSQSIWVSFLANCVLNDPPDMDLTSFAASGNSMGVSYVRVSLRDVDLEARKVRSLSDMSATIVGAPIVHWPNPDEVLQAERKFWFELLAEMDRHLAASGIDVYALVNEILQGTGLLKASQQRHALLPLHSLITFDSGTTKEDVESAFRAIAATQKDRSEGGRPALDRLTAVQCAIWKRQGWTDVQIAERFGWPLRRDSYDKRRRSNVVINHLKLGNQILGSRKNPAG